MSTSFFRRDPRRWRVAFSKSTSDRILSDQERVPEAGEAFLIVRGPEDLWRNIFRMTTEQVTTVGREPVNRLVIDDDRCSRRHCEFFFDVDRWFLRDLQSRNGTALNGKKVHGDNPIRDGDRIRIGNTVLLFTTDISTPLPDKVLEDFEAPASEQRSADADDETGINGQEGSDTDAGQDEAPEPQILERKSQTRFVTSRGSDVADGGLRDAFGLLCRLIMDMVTAQDVKSLAQTVLNTLLSTVNADIGAVLLFTDPSEESLTPEHLRVVGYQAPENTPYQLVSRRLSNIVLQEREGILALDIRDAGGQNEFQTLGEIKAESVICAPIRCDEVIFGLLHLYSLDAQNSLDADALDFTLAVADQLAVALDNLSQKESLTTGLKVVYDENKSLRRLLEIESELVGTSLEMQRLRDTIARVATSDATALIRGESGVGKELVARAVHFNSGRRHEPFVCLNCAALTETLLESELFGHEKGSFTGATDQKIGKFEQADGGTLFLDEVGEMPPSIQAKFLRVLEGHAFERVGGSTNVQCEVRVVAATNRNLEAAVEEGKFRRDLFFRLQILEIEVPSLREHASDIPLLAQYFLERSGERMGKTGMRIEPEAMQILSDYEWPGNIRELRNVIERAVVLTEGQQIRPASIRFSSLPGVSEKSGGTTAARFEPIPLEELEKEHIRQMLEWTGGKKREAARLLGINRSTLDRKLERYNIPCESK